VADQLSIANRALLSIGARAQISSLNPSDGSTEAAAISTLWQPTFESLGRAAPWNVLTKQVTLTLLMAAQGTPENPNGTSLPVPPTPWLYAYSYPSDCLLFRFVVPSLPVNTGSTVPATTVNNAAGTWLPTQGQIPFAVSSIGDSHNSPILIVLTNQDLAQAVYNANNSNPAIWDSLFQAAMVASLAAFLVPALSLSMPLIDRQIKIAETAIAVARRQDGNEGVTTMDHLPDWMQARAGGQGFGIGYGFSTWGGFTNVCWPTSGAYGY
jgi:hypothetical protein